MNIIKLPAPGIDSNCSVEKALKQRRSVRSFSDSPLTLKEISQLLWAAQGIVNFEGFRTAPSAGALYPIEIYVVVSNIDELIIGIYKYKAHQHSLIMISDDDNRYNLASAAIGEAAIKNCPAIIAIAALFERTAIRYGDRGARYVHIEAGHVVQNIYLQAESLNLGTFVIGAFYDDEVKKYLRMEQDENPVCLMPVGRR